MLVDPPLFRRFAREVRGPADVLEAIGQVLLDQIHQADRLRERDFLIRTAAEMLPPAALYTKAKAIRAEMLALARSSMPPAEGSLRETIRNAVLISRGPLSVRHIFRILKDS